MLVPGCMAHILMLTSLQCCCNALLRSIQCVGELRSTVATANLSAWKRNSSSVRINLFLLGLVAWTICLKGKSNAVNGLYVLRVMCPN